MNLDEIISSIKQFKNHKSVLIAIEGYGGSGKSTVAEKLKQQLTSAEIIKIDSFIVKQKARDAEPWEEVFDRERLKEQILEPQALGNPIIYQRLDWEKNKLGVNITLPKADYLIIDGIASYHPDIEAYYDFKIWVDTPIDVAKKRGKSRDSNNENVVMWEKWAQCDLAYQQKYHPELRADFIVNNEKGKVGI